MNSIYNHNSIDNWPKIWKDKKQYRPNYKLKNRYCITIPPPNITGKLHMGHAFQCTLMDILIRYYKMRQFSVLWKFGTDHAGIATQILFDQKLDMQNQYNGSYKTFKLQKYAIKKIKKQITKLGFLVNWDTSRFTLDKHFSYAVRTAFIELYNDGLIYKTTKLVNWDTKMQTAISDLEIKYKNDISKLYNIKYRVAGCNDFLIVATTRPETIFADVAVAINKSDVRYHKYIGKNVVVPISNKEVPIICDDYVDPNFGTGCLKVTPAHDFKDFEIADRHKLPFVNIITKNGLLNDNVPENYVNLTIEAARLKVALDLNELNLCNGIDEYKNKIPIADRSGCVVEPFLTPQWYINVKPLIVPVYKALDANKICITPYRWKNVFMTWLENIKDWCISRQIWWGHQIPLWYDNYNNFYLGHNIDDVITKYNLSNNVDLIREKDVLDTWFSSALWPFASLGWPVNKKEFKEFYPTSTLVTGFDIIFFWVIRMLMFGLKFTQCIPFKEIYIHGLIRDHYGSKMSKTKGNVIDPLDIVMGITKNELIKKQISGLLNLSVKDKVVDIINKSYPEGIKSYGVDALRLMLASMATHKIALKMDIKNVEKYKSFCNKLWNANNFLNSCKSMSVDLYVKRISGASYDNYILAVWEKTKKFISNCILKRKFSNALNCLYEFFWYEFCDWYIEVIKKLNHFSGYMYESKKIANNVFKEFILVLHPFAPCITEQLWSNKCEKAGNILSQCYPLYKKKFYSKRYFLAIDLFKKIICVIRNNKDKIIDINIASFFIVIKTYKNILLIEKIIYLLKSFFKCCYCIMCYENQSNNYVEVMNDIVLLYRSDIAVALNNKYLTQVDRISLKIKDIEKILQNDVFLQKAASNIIANKRIQLLQLKQQLGNITRML